MEPREQLFALLARWRTAEWEDLSSGELKQILDDLGPAVLACGDDGDRYISDFWRCFGSQR